ncbi:regulatory protein [Salmonella bongori]|nr:regulatory protein [Salmonella bongori]
MSYSIISTYTVCRGQKRVTNWTGSRLAPGFERPLAFVCHDYSQLVPAVQSAPLMAIVPCPWYENLSDKRGLFVLPLAGEQAEGANFYAIPGFQRWNGNDVLLSRLFAGN